jgi:hypothetical protein
LNDENITGTVLYREADFSTSLIGVKTVIDADIIVYWEDAQGIHEVRSTTAYADWRQR